MMKGFVVVKSATGNILSWHEDEYEAIEEAKKLAEMGVTTNVMQNLAQVFPYSRVVPQA